MIEPFRLLQEGFALRGEVLSQRWESTQWPRPPSLAPSGQFTLRIAGGRRRGELRSPMTAYPRSPVTGVTPWVGQNISGAQNLSDVLNFRRATGPWVCGKLWRMRFHRRAWLCRTNGGSPKGLPYPTPQLLRLCRRGGACPSRLKAFPLPGGRCPRRGRMRVGSGIAVPPAGRENVRPLRIGGIIFTP